MASLSMCLNHLLPPSHISKEKPHHSTKKQINNQHVLSTISHLEKYSLFPGSEDACTSSCITTAPSHTAAQQHSCSSEAGQEWGEIFVSCPVSMQQFGFQGCDRWHREHREALTCRYQPRTPWCDPWCSAACYLFSLLTAHQLPTNTRESVKAVPCSAFWTADSPPPPCAALNSASICTLLPSEPRSADQVLWALHPKAVCTQIQQPFAPGPQEARGLSSALQHIPLLCQLSRDGSGIPPHHEHPPGRTSALEPRLSVIVTVYLHFV